MGRVGQFALASLAFVVLGCGGNQEPAAGPAQSLGTSAPQTVRADGSVAPMNTDADPSAALAVVVVRDFRVTSHPSDRTPGCRAAAKVSLKNAVNVAFTMQAVITDAKGVPLVFDGKTFEGSCLVKTSDEEDEDNYSAFIPCPALFTSANAPKQVYVQVRVMDPQGKVHAASGMQPVTLR